MKSFPQGPELPLGLGMALTQNLQTMRRFTGLSVDEQQSIIDRTHDISPKKEMRAFVDNLFN